MQIWRPSAVKAGSRRDNWDSGYDTLVKIAPCSVAAIFFKHDAIRNNVVSIPVGFVDISINRHKQRKFLDVTKGLFSLTGQRTGAVNGIAAPVNQSLGLIRFLVSNRKQNFSGIETGIVGCQRMVDMFGRIRIFLVLHVLGILGGAFIRIVPANTHYPVLRYSAFDIFQVIVAAEPHEAPLP